MKFKIVVDSCCDLTKEMKKDAFFETVPLELQIGDYITPDDDTFDQKDFLKRIAESPICAKSACPSPERFLRAYQCGAKEIYVITLSSKLSGSYNSAMLAKTMLEEVDNQIKVHVFDSCSASSGEFHLALFLRKIADSELSFKDVVMKTLQYQDKLGTYFVLDNLETLRKNGRLSLVKAFVASTLNIKPIMGATKEGEIVQLNKAIGMKKALQKLVETIEKDRKFDNNGVLVISHCNCFERAELVRDMILEKIAYKEVHIIDTAGISTMYANDGGIIVVA